MTSVKHRKYVAPLWANEVSHGSRDGLKSRSPPQPRANLDCKNVGGDWRIVTVIYLQQSSQRTPLTVYMRR